MAFEDFVKEMIKLERRHDENEEKYLLQDIAFWAICTAFLVICDRLFDFTFLIYKAIEIVGSKLI